MASLNDNYVIEQFTLKDSDIKEFSELITGAFLADEVAQDEGAVLVFTEQTFRTIFGAPGTVKDLFVRARHKPTNEIVGFLGTINKNLSRKKVKNLANFMSEEAIKLGWKGLQTPYIPYFDAKPFIKANFIFFSKKVGIDLFNWSNIPIPEKIDSMFFYWR